MMPGALSKPGVEPGPPGKTACPECHGEGSLIVSSTGPEHTLPCPRCAGAGYIEARPLVLGYRTTRVDDREWTEEITLGSLLTYLVLTFHRLSSEFSGARRG